MASPSPDFGGVRTAQRIWDAIEKLSAIELTKLKRYAELRLLALGQTGLEWRDVLHSAALSIASGSRCWPEHITLYAMLRGTIRSLTDVRGMLTVSDLEPSGLTPECPSIEPSQERMATAKEEVEAIYREFAQDDQALRVIDGWAIGLTGPEICQSMGMNETDFNTVVRRITRHLNHRGRP
jgi:hypothetical protein